MRLAPIPSMRQPTPLAALLALALACGGGGGSATPAPLESLTLDRAQAYVAVGHQDQLTATGRYADGTERPMTDGVTWSSTDASVVAVSSTGLVIPWAKGSVQITVTDDATGLAATAAVLSREVVFVSGPEDLAASGRVDTSMAYFRVSGLSPGAMYATRLSGMSDDVDLEVYPDAAMAPESRVCASRIVGREDESCSARASGAGELWVAVDGQWTQSGASFRVEVSAAAPIQVAATLAFPGQLPYAGSVGVAKQFLRVTGLTPGTTYEARISGLTADLDLEVYTDDYEYASLCESFSTGTADDFCNATADMAGEFVIEIDGLTSVAGGPFTLSLAPR